MKLSINQKKINVVDLFTDIYRIILGFAKDTEYLNIKTEYILSSEINPEASLVDQKNFAVLNEKPVLGNFDFEVYKFLDLNKIL